MSGKEKARPTVGAAERATEPEVTSHENPGSTLKFTTSGGGGQIQISGFLLHGAENGVTLCRLKQLTGLPGRYIRRRIQEERLSGIPILSDNTSGYFLPENDQERRRFVQSMRGRANEIEAVAAAVEGGGY